MLTTHRASHNDEPNKQIDISAEVTQLHSLTGDITALKHRLHRDRPAPDPAGLRWLIDRIGDAQQLTRGVLERLEHLEGCQLASAPGHGAVLNCLAALAHDTAAAGMTLATALLAFPFDAADSHPGRDQAARNEATTGRSLNAGDLLREVTRDAAATLAACDSACAYVATALTQQIPASPSNDAPGAPARPSKPTAPEQGSSAARSEPRSGRVKLSTAQKNALQAIAAGGVTMYDSSRIGNPKISASRGVRITMRTYEALHSLGLVSRDTSTNLLRGQKIHLTDAGRAALPPTTTATTASTAPAGPAAQPPSPRHR